MIKLKKLITILSASAMLLSVGITAFADGLVINDPWVYEPTPSQLNNDCNIYWWLNNGYNKVADDEAGTLTCTWSEASNSQAVLIPWATGTDGDGVNVNQMLNRGKVMNEMTLYMDKSAMTENRAPNDNVYMRTDFYYFEEGSSSLKYLDFRIWYEPQKDASDGDKEPFYYRIIDNGTTIQEGRLHYDTTYTIRYEADVQNKTMSLTILDQDGNVFKDAVGASVVYKADKPSLAATRLATCLYIKPSINFVLYDYKVKADKYLIKDYALTDDGENYTATVNVAPNVKTAVKSPTLLLGQFKSNNQMLSSAFLSSDLTIPETKGDAGLAVAPVYTPVTVTLPKANSAAQARAVIWSDLTVPPVLAYDQMKVIP